MINETPVEKFEKLMYSKDDYKSDEGEDIGDNEPNKVVYHYNTVPFLL